MNCPPEIAAILLRMMTLGLLQIRFHANDPDRYFIESDHLHNLPGMVRNYSPSLLTYYWDVERPCFIARTQEAAWKGFEPLWDELRPHVEPRNATSSS